MNDPDVEPPLPQCRIIGCDPKVSPLAQTCRDEEANDGCVLGFSSVPVGMMPCRFFWHDLDRLFKKMSFLGLFPCKKEATHVSKYNEKMTLRRKNDLV
jgi:hypothetical protein